jgi:UDP-N-acetylmuramate dehydrogenase
VKIESNFSLKNHNSFGIDVEAKEFISVNSITDLQKILIQKNNKKILFIGGGSNILFTKNLDCLVVHLNLKGISTKKIDNEFTEVTIAAGENWNKVVNWCVENNLGGIENLSLIPGNSGTAPIQNIGAYGVELKDTFVSCNVLDINTNKTFVLNNKECEFNYRDSIFKRNKKLIVLDIKLKLKHQNHSLNFEYGIIRDKLLDYNIQNPTIRDISKIIVEIRKEKLPDPKLIGNSGSFFKNPIISKDQLLNLKINFEDIPSYKISDLKYKIPAAWLIEKAGFKGKRIDNYGVHKNQALVLVNYGGSSGSEIHQFSKTIQKAIKFIFNIDLESEVNII